jgi:2'-5' RNA ligase
MRTFIAIDLPSELKDKVNKLISELRNSGFCDAKWVSEQQLHLTLKFLGEIKQQDVAKVEFILKEIASKTKVFSLQLKGLGHFNQRVLWIGGNSGGEEFVGLAKSVDEKLSVLGFEKETKEFAVHLTLARIKYIEDKAKFQQVLDRYENADFGVFKVNSMKLMESVLAEQGPIYKTLREFNLL